MKYRITILVGVLVCFCTTAIGWGTRVDDSFYSSAMDSVMMVDVHLPEGYNSEDATQRYPVIYFLHWHSADVNSGESNVIQYWTDAISSGSIPPMILVKPDGYVEPFKGSWWINSQYYGNYEDYIVHDLIEYIDSTYNTFAEKDYRSLLGYSMGGYGSMVLGLKHPDRFGAVSSHSGAFLSSVWIPDYVHNEVLVWEGGGSGPFDPTSGMATETMFNFGACFSPNPDSLYGLVLAFDNEGNMIDSVFALWKKHSATRWAMEYETSNDLAIQFTVGTEGWMESYFSVGNSAFADTLDSLGIPYEFQIYPCSHTGMLQERTMAGFSFIDSVMHTTTTPGAIDGQPEMLWSKTIGDTLGYFTSVSQASDGGFVMTGPHIEDHIWGVRVDAMGDTIWTRDIAYMEGQSNDHSRIIGTSDGGFLVTSGHDPWLIKHSLDGTILWEKSEVDLGLDTLPSYNGYMITDGLELDDGNFVFCGFIEYSDYRHCLLVRTDNLGTIVWLKEFGSGYIMSITKTSAAHLVGVGNFSALGDTGPGIIEISLDGDTPFPNIFRSNLDSDLTGEWYSVRSVSETSDGGFILSGRLKDNNGKDLDKYYVAKTGATLGLQWDKTYGGDFFGEAYFAVQVDSMFMVSGFGTDTTDGGTGGPWTLLLSDTGGVIWSDDFDIPGTNVAMDIVEVDPGEYLFAGVSIISYDPFHLDGFLLRVTLNGSTVSTEPILESLPDNCYLTQNFPNPFNPTTTISYVLTEQIDVNLTVFDMRGRELTTLQNREQPAGHYEVQWNGVDESGNPVSTGIYFARFQAGDYSKTIKMVYLK